MGDPLHWVSVTCTLTDTHTQNYMYAYVLGVEIELTTLRDNVTSGHCITETGNAWSWQLGLNLTQMNHSCRWPLAFRDVVSLLNGSRERLTK